MTSIRFCVFHEKQIDARGVFTPIIGYVVRVNDDISSLLPLFLLLFMPGINVDAKLRVVNFQLLQILDPSREIYALDVNFVTVFFVDRVAEDVYQRELDAGEPRCSPTRISHLSIRY